MTLLSTWVNNKIKNGDINHFEYDEFSNLEKVGKGAHGTVKKADWKSGGVKIALKVLANNSTVNENNMKKFLNEGNLREYLKIYFKSLQWNNKIQMALDIACGLKFLHSIQIIHRDLHAKNILVHDNKLMIADLGLAKQLTGEIASHSTVYGMPAYIEPQCYKNDAYIRDKKSDIYSLGVLLWEISSGHPPFLNSPRHTISIKVANGIRENSVINTPLAYVNLYEKCWSDDPNLRPIVDDVFNVLKEISNKYNTNDEINPKIIENLIELDLNSDSIEQNDSQSQSSKSTSLTIDNNYDLSLSQFENIPDITDANSKGYHSKSFDISRSYRSSHYGVDSYNNNNNNNLLSPSVSVSSIINKDVGESSGYHLNSSRNLNVSQSYRSSYHGDDSRNIYGNDLPLPSVSVSSIINKDERELSNTMDEVIQCYLKYNNIGWTKNFDFDKALGKYKSKSKEIFNYLINNPTLQHYEVMVGKFYNEGFGVDKDENTAFQWYMKASQKNDMNGHYEVGYYYDYKEIVKQQYIISYQLAANNGLNIASYYLANSFKYNYGTQTDYFELYKQSAENGFIPSQYELAECYSEGIKENKMEALKWYKLYQENDGNYNVTTEIEDITNELKNNSSLLSVSQLLSISPSFTEEEREIFNALDEIIQNYLKRNKIGWTKSFDFNKILKKYESKSEDIFNFLISNPTIQHYEVMIGIFYDEGFGVDKNEIIAFQRYLNASEQNNINGYYEVGYYRYNHDNDKEEAFKYYQIAASNGLNIALYRLAIYYEFGNDTAKAFELYKQSAENGYIPSQHKLAKCYEYSVGTNGNRAEALKWYKLYQENDGFSDVSDDIKEIMEQGLLKRILSMKKKH
ncbi:hypothetical protein C1645_807102 [Glomus cerebriforme]|uniref:Protein kinase domain-containing protein n=1 Tax=Glomus cerebriforme TaxID=658196 RepID=A0A397SYN3_9GLOM|nr:hypothetical protein C1645_807102 [Glomus cerebriforme]